MSCGLGLPRKTKRRAQEWVSTATGGCRLSVESGLSTVNAGWNRQQQLCSARRRNPPRNTLTSLKTATGDVACIFFAPIAPGGVFFSFLRISGLTGADVTSHWDVSCRTTKGSDTLSLSPPLLLCERPPSLETVDTTSEDRRKSDEVSWGQRLPLVFPPKQLWKVLLIPHSTWQQHT